MELKLRLIWLLLTMPRDNLRTPNLPTSIYWRPRILIILLKMMLGIRSSTCLIWLLPKLLIKLIGTVQLLRISRSVCNLALLVIKKRKSGFNRFSLPKMFWRKFQRRSLADSKWTRRCCSAFWSIQPKTRRNFKEVKIGGKWTKI